MSAPEWLMTAADPVKAAEQLSARLLVCRELGPTSGLPDWVKQAVSLGDAQSWVSDNVTGPLTSGLKSVGLPDDAAQAAKPALIGAGIGAGIGGIQGMFGKKKRPLLGALYGGMMGGLAGGAGGYLYNRFAPDTTPKPDAVGAAIGGPGGAYVNKSLAPKPTQAEVAAANSLARAPEALREGEIIQQGFTGKADLTPGMPSSVGDAAASTFNAINPVQSNPGSLTSAVAGGAGVGGLTGYGAGHAANRLLGDKVTGTTLGGEVTKTRLNPKGEVLESFVEQSKPTQTAAPRSLQKPLGRAGALLGGVGYGLRNLYQQGRQTLAAGVGTNKDLAAALKTQIANVPPNFDDPTGLQKLQQIQGLIQQLETNPTAPVSPAIHDQAARLSTEADRLGLVMGAKR